MTKAASNWFLIVVFCFLFTAAQAQKVKYKDIFGLLNTKQYESAEPFLKKYLRDNDDNPNAFLFMGIIFHEKAGKLDVLKQTPLVLAYLDSATIFYTKAYQTIDEREVKKNKDYYQSYNKRDLRTGEFGVQLSDIQYDLEKRQEIIKERSKGVKSLKSNFASADTTYKKALKMFSNLQQSYPSLNQLYLRADETTIKQLKDLALTYDTCVKAFQNYKAGISPLGRIGYNQNLAPVEIADFKKDGTTGQDFYADELKLWDFKKFSERSLQIIEKDIIPMRSHLVTYDNEINKLRDRLNADSVSVKSDLTKLIDVLLYQQLKKYDEEPLPMEVFSMKTADLEYRSALIDHKRLRDSANFHFKLSLLDTEMKYLGRLDSITNKLSNSDIDQKAIDYGYFVTQSYSNTIVLHSHVKALKEYAEREKKRKAVEFEKLQESLRWMVDGNDSIPLIQEQLAKRFKPLVIENEKYTIGLAFKDSLTANGYFYKITPSRTPQLKFNFQVDKAAFKQARFANTKALTFADAGGQIYYVLIYSNRLQKDKYPATLTKIYTSDGVAWSNNITLGFIPTQLAFTPETSEVTIKDETAKLMVIDKNGKVIKQ